MICSIKLLHLQNAEAMFKLTLRRMHLYVTFDCAPFHVGLHGPAFAPFVQAHFIVQHTSTALQGKADMRSKLVREMKKVYSKKVKDLKWEVQFQREQVVAAYNFHKQTNVRQIVHAASIFQSIQKLLLSIKQFATCSSLFYKTSWWHAANIF